jgi:hypothetical protein
MTARKETKGTLTVPPLEEEGLAGTPKTEAGPDDIGLFAAGDTASEPKAEIVQEQAFKVAGGEYRVGESLPIYKEVELSEARIQRENLEAWQKGKMAEEENPVIRRRDLQDALAAMRAELAGQPQRDGVNASAPGGIFACPICGLPISGPSLTSQKGGLYEHGFGESVKLPGGQRCQYQGRKFRPPMVFLEVVPLTAKK